MQFINFPFYGLFLLSSLRTLCLAQASEDFPLFFSKFYSFPFYIQSPLCICCCYSVTKSCRTLWPRGLQHARLPCPSLFSRSLLKLMSLESVILSNHLIVCHPLLFLASIFPSIRVISSESTLCIRWPKCWHFSFSISPSNEYPGLISSRIDWFNLLAVQGTLKSLLQDHSSKASILQCSCSLWFNSHIHT